MRISAIIFDLDEVLIDSYGDHLYAFVLAARKFGIKLHKKEVRKIYHKFGKSAREIIHDVEPQMTKKELDKFVEVKDRIYRKIVAKRGIKLLKGVKEILKFLRKKKVKTAIASSATRRNIYLALRQDRIKKFFHVIVSAEDTKRHKPHPDPLIKAARLLRVKPKNCAYVGDSVYEIISARRARMDGIGVTTGTYSANDLKRNGAKKVFKDLLQLKKFFEQNPQIFT